MARGVSQQTEAERKSNVKLPSVDWARILLPVMQQIDEMRRRDGSD